MLDSGIRSGEDVLRGLSLGAEFVFSGRSFAYGAAAAGPAGASKALSIFKGDILRGMAQLGITNLTDLRSRGASKAGRIRILETNRVSVRSDAPAIADFRSPIAT